MAGLAESATGSRKVKASAMGCPEVEVHSRLNSQLDTWTTLDSLVHTVATLRYSAAWSCHHLNFGVIAATRGTPCNTITKHRAATARGISENA